MALTHRSFAFEQGLPEDNERLEFLGDAVIGMVTSEVLYQMDSKADEGVLSKRRSRLVSRALLGRRALEMGLGDVILLGRGERDSGGGKRRSILGSALEALVGIIYLRLGYDQASDFIRQHILKDLLKLTATDELQGDYKSALQEWAQQRLHQVPVYRRVGEEGPDHSKRFFVTVSVAGAVLARGEGSRIKSAENDAARRALGNEKIRQNLEKDHPIED